MKGRESGMPDETYWETFFAADEAIARLFGPTAIRGDCIEFGCGYGTFTVPAARRTTGLVTALDIEPVMVECVRQKAATFKLSNIRAISRDYAALGDALWQRFNQKDKAEHAWYYASVARCLEELRVYPAWQEYDRLVRSVFGGENA